MKEKQLKQIIAEAIYTGTLLAEQNYGGEIQKENYRPFVNALTELKQRVLEYTTQNNLEEINIDDIFPVNKEIETLLNL